MRACEFGSVAGVEALLEKGADVNARDRHNYLPLHHAVWCGDTKLARVLLAAGAVATAWANGSKPILLAAAENNHGEMVDLLLSSGAKVDGRDPQTGESALHRAAWAGAGNAAAVLFAAKADLDAQDNVMTEAPPPRPHHTPAPLAQVAGSGRMHQEISHADAPLRIVVWYALIVAVRRHTIAFCRAQLQPPDGAVFSVQWRG
jgi:ankyrin repeat protein